VIAPCPAGKRVIAGGCSITYILGTGANEAGVYRDGPVSGTGWEGAVVRGADPTAWTWRVYAICIIDGS
jgi:hypothetical protein